jgi:uncharacterized membrane protein
VKSLEARVLSRVPFYHFVKGMTESVVEAESDTTLRSVLVRLDDYSQLAFEVERLPGGDVVVFLPGAPNPWSGAVCVVAPERVTQLDAPMLAAVQTIATLETNSSRSCRWRRARWRLRSANESETPLKSNCSRCGPVRWLAWA